MKTLKKMLRFILFCMCFLFTVHAGYPFAEQDGVINLGEPTWQLAIDEFPQGLLVYFYEPLCYPCRVFWPELIEAAETQKNSHVRFAKVECHDEVKVCNARNVYTFPTLMLYRAGREPFEYRGERTADALQAWVKKVGDYKFKEINSEETLFSHYSTALLVKTQTDAINKASELIHDDVEIAVAGSSLQGKVGKNAAAIYTQTGQTVVVPEGDSAEDIQSKVNDVLETQKTGVPNLNAKLYGLIQDGASHNFVVFFRTKNFKYNTDATKRFDKAAKDLAEVNQYFVYANAASDDLIGTTVGKLFGVENDSSPAVGIIVKKNKVLQKYKLEGDISFESIQKLLDDVKSGKAKRYYMSAPSSSVPATAEKGKVQELITGNYAEATTKSGKNVFVMLYFPWCEWCVKLEPTWNALAYRVRDQSDLTIARIDVSKNDVEGYEASEYPILLFYPKAGGKAVEYLSARNIRNLKEFLAEKVTGLKENIEL